MGMCKALSRGAWVLERGRADVSETQCPGKTENILKFQSVFRVGRGDEDAASDQAELGWEEEGEEAEA